MSSWWLLLTAFVGLNLVQSAFTGFCPAEMIFRKLGVGRSTEEKCDCLSIAASLALPDVRLSEVPHTSGAKLPPAVTVRVETIEVKPHPVTEEVIGTVRAKIRAAVEAKVSGASPHGRRSWAAGERRGSYR